MQLADAIRRLVDGVDLSEAEMAGCMETILDGGADPAAVAGFLVALRLKGETVAELVAGARVLRAHTVPVAAPPGAVDTCGTGGDGARTLNVSTAAGLVAAAAGVPVAKHGNRAVSGAIGGADVLEALGVTVELPPDVLSTCLGEIGFAFLFAPAFHPALRAAAPVRRALGVRTVFNLLGPLANPAGVRRQVIGVFDRRWVEPMARVLSRLGTERAWVVHGAGGLDELALDGESVVGEVVDGEVKIRTVTAGEVGLAPAPVDALRVVSLGDAVARVRSVLAGERGPARDVVCLNAGAALVVAGAAETLRAGAERAAAAIDDGRAAALLTRLVRFTSERAATRSAS